MNRMRTPRFRDEHARRVRTQADLLDLLWDEDKENIPPLAMLDSLNLHNIQPPAHIRDPESPELGTARPGFASRFEELRIHNEGPPATLTPFTGTQPPYYQGYESPVRNEDGEDLCPRATRGVRLRDQESDDWEIYVDYRDRERHYFHYDSDEVSLSLDGEGADDEAEADSGPSYWSSDFEAQIETLLASGMGSSPEPEEEPEAETEVGPEAIPAFDFDFEPELPTLPAPQMDRRLVPSASEGTLLPPRPIARMRRRRGSRSLREQARMGNQLREQVNTQS